MLSAEYVRSIPDIDAECREALAWLCEHGEPYPSGGFTPPLTRRNKLEELKPCLAMTIRMARQHRTQNKGVKISSITVTDGNTESSWQMAGYNPQQLCVEMVKCLFNSANSGRLIVTSGLQHARLDLFLETFGPLLLQSGYQIQPCLTAGAVSWLKIRKSKRTWTIAYLEGMTGSDVTTCLQLANIPESDWTRPELLCRNLWQAATAYGQWLVSTFGISPRATVGMVAMQCARKYVPEGIRKWRPDPLLVAMERDGLGYRSGITYARRHRGKTWRVDVIRQYTAALSQPLPLQSRFDRYEPGNIGVYMCRLSTPKPIHYPVGIWTGHGFARNNRLSKGTYVCVLHSQEFEGLEAMGVTITPTLGFRFTRTFSLAEYVERLQNVLDTVGYQSPASKLTKPLGNYVYGKMGQKPTRTELLFTLTKPDKSWYPYWDADGKQWKYIWDRVVRRDTMSQHVDIASTVAAVARNQTVLMKHWLESQAIPVVRIHTDSLTTSADPSPCLAMTHGEIGGWREEYQDVETIIVGANAFFDGDGAHISGVSSPTYEMVEALYDGAVVRVVEQQMAPRRAWQREARESIREYRTTADG